MEKPAGVQIKRWFLTLVALLLIVNLISVVSLFIVYKQIEKIRSVYQPIMKSSSVINEKIMVAQIDLFKYLAEYQSDLDNVFLSAGELGNELKSINEIIAAENIASMDPTLISGISDATTQFENSIKQLEKQEEKETKDWEKINLYKNYAVDTGTDTLNKAMAVSNSVTILITKHNIQVTQIALVVVCILTVFLVISIVVMIQLLHWWRKFEDIILEM